MKAALQRRAWLEAAAVAALGALQTASFVVTSMWWLTLLCTAALVWRIDATTPRRAALLAWCYGTAWLCAGTWWLFISMHRYGGMPAPLAALAVLALCAALSLYMAAAAALYARWRSGNALGDAGLFAALWLLAELARELIFTGFPWLASGYSQVDSLLAVLAPWIGVHGIGAVLAFVSVLTVREVFSETRGLRRRLPAAATVVALVALAWLGPHDFTQPSGTLSVSLLQSNVAQDEKFNIERLPQSLAWAARSLTASQADLVLGPETLIPLLPSQLAEVAPELWPALRSRFAGAPQAALVGMPLGDLERGYSNSVVSLSDVLPGIGYRYDKHHLVPFGEFIPTGFRWFTQLMEIPLGDFARGRLDAPSFDVRGERVAPNICYEDLFGAELAVRFADAAQAPTVLANVSNIGWFGDTIAIAQHLNISRMRTLELQRPMLRATNTGATAIIDHRGIVTARLAPFTQGVLDGRVQGRVGNTPFADWASRCGQWPLIVLALSVVLGLRVLPRPVALGQR